MAYAIFVLGMGGQAAQEGGPAQGWLTVADVEAHGGRGWAEMSTDQAKALTFASPADAFEFWRRQSRTRPVRPDGKPNRPLTAFTVEIVNLDLGRVFERLG